MNIVNRLITEERSIQQPASQEKYLIPVVRITYPSMVEATVKDLGADATANNAAPQRVSASALTGESTREMA